MNTNLIAEQGHLTTHDRLRLLHIANRGLKELTFDILGSTKVSIIDVDSTLRIDLPADYIDYEFVGVIDGDNRLNPLGFNNRIPLGGGVNQNTQFDDSYHYVNGGLFGIGGGQNSDGYYSPKIDEENMQMILSSVAVGLTVYLEYISDGRQTDGLTVIHPYAEEALMSWIYWKSIQRSRHFPQSEKQAARRDYYNDKRNARKRLKSFTKEEAMQQFRKGFKQAPKI
jgi:hypothetical protein